MTKLNSRILSAFMTLLLVFSLLSGITFTANAATVNYQTAYVSDKYPSVIKNWGTREEMATFLSPNAEAFYSKTSYESLIALNGSSNISVVNTSALYIALNSLMKNAHTKTTSYDATRDMYQYTDCQNNGAVSAKISAFYSGEDIGPAWDGGATWNREHVWPNSKGGDGSNEDDIMMLRPETKSNNSSRGNAAFGESNGYYNPETKFSNDFDVRGDIARIVLYTYVRWGTEEQAVLDYMWGTDGVIESKAILLKWMEEDPVDTWEMGRNDSVQSITGTRNVFVDYPEFAFALFNEEIPQMTTPSGKAGASEQSSYTVECYENGVLKSSEQVQNGSKYTLGGFKGTIPEGYSFVGWSTTQVEETTQKPTVYTAGTQIVAKGNTKYYAVLSSYNAEVEGQREWTLVTNISQISSGSEVVITAKDYDYAMSTEQKSNNRGQAAVTKSGNKLSCDSNVAVFTLQSGTSSGSYAFYTGSGYLFAVNKTNNYLRTQSTLNSAASFNISVSSDGTCKITSVAYVSDTAGVGNVPMQYNTDGMFACYPKATQQKLSLYVGQYVSGATTYTTSWTVAGCTHAETTTTTVAATCTVAGSVTVSCTSCGVVLSTTVLPASHSYQYEEVAPTLSASGYTREYCSLCGDETIEDEVAPLTNIESWGLTLADDVSVKFKINVDNSIRSTAKIHINNTTYSVSELTSSNGSYFLTVNLTASQMTEEITVQITNGADQTEKKAYTVKAYAETILAGDYPAATKTLVTQMLHYGAAAQTYFDYKTSSLANAGLSAAVQETPKAATAYGQSGVLEGVEFYGAALMLREKVAVRYYFTVAGDISEYTFTANGVACNPVKKGSNYYIEVAGINPQQLNDSITVKVNDALTVQYSPMNYIAHTYAKGSGDLQALVQALYGYYLAAKAYTNS